MSIQVSKLPHANQKHVDRKIIKLAIMAVGGQGGGVLTNWIEKCASSNGYAVQATSVAGVAQRTGATIYYIEMLQTGIEKPVFALMPSAGDVDILIASEMAEAGRAIVRGFVTPERTTLIASTHRILAVAEKSVPGDGIMPTEEVETSAKAAAKRLINFDMEKIAVETGSVISASLYGALAGSKTLPFSRESFEAAIRSSDYGVEASLFAFSVAFEHVEKQEIKPTKEASQRVTPTYKAIGNAKLVADWQVLEAEVEKLPGVVQPTALLGLRKVVDFQDTKYGHTYLNRLVHITEYDDSTTEYRLSREAAKQIANAMAYDDVIRVADLKTRGERMIRIKQELGTNWNNGLKITEFLHPRAEEIVGMLPTKIGSFIEKRSGWMKLITRIFSKRLLVRTDTLKGFLLLYFLGGLRNFRRRSFRYSFEQTHINKWLSSALAYIPNDYELAVGVIRARRLIKGYADTHARGSSKYDRVLAGINLLSGRRDAFHWLQRLEESAMKDEHANNLNETLKKIRSVELL